MKHIESFKMPPGSLFSSIWKGQEPLWYYRVSVSIEYKCWLMNGKQPPIFMPNRHYNNDINWMSSDVLTYPEYLCKEYIIDIHHTEKKDVAIQNVLETFNGIVDSCPSDNVIVFGYDLKFEGDEIIPETYPAPPKLYCAEINCGFAGY